MEGHTLKPSPFADPQIEDRIKISAEAWHQASRLADNKRTELIKLIRTTSETTHVSEARIAKAAGVNRQTVRAWLGK